MCKCVSLYEHNGSIWVHANVSCTPQVLHMAPLEPDIYCLDFHRAISMRQLIERTEKDYMITWDGSGREGWQLPCRMQTHSWPQQQLCGHWSQSFLLHLPQQSLLWIGTPTLGSWPLLEAESIWIYLNLVPSIRCFWRAAKHPSPDSDGIYTDFGFFKAGQPWHSDQWFRGANIPGFKV